MKTNNVIKLRPGQKAQPDYLQWSHNKRISTCVICGKEIYKNKLIYRGWSFCQDDLPEGFERWNGSQEIEINIPPKPTIWQGFKNWIKDKLSN